jgi:nucleoside-diphosphate-sugar epimerase
MVQAIWACVENPESAQGQVFNVSDTPILTMRQIVQMIAQARGKSPLIVNVPLAPVQALLGGHDRLWGSSRGRTLLPSLAAFSSSSMISSEHIHSTLRYQPPIPHEEGIRRMADAYR